MAEIIKCRRPKYPSNWLTRWYRSYNSRWWKWYKSLPKEGQRIKITWLPPPRNNPGEVNCYTGTGTFHHGKINPYWDEDFYFVYDSGATLIMIGGSFDYIDLTHQPG